MPQTHEELEEKTAKEEEKVKKTEIEKSKVKRKKGSAKERANKVFPKCTFSYVCVNI